MILLYLIQIVFVLQKEQHVILTSFGHPRNILETFGSYGWLAQLVKWSPTSREAVSSIL